MKTIEQVKSRINEILTTYEGLEEKEIKKLRREKDFLDIVLKYLETNPSYDFLLKERDGLTTRISLINDGFPDFVKQNTSKETDNLLVLRTLREMYNKEFDITGLNRHLKTLLFILSNDF